MISFVFATPNQKLIRYKERGIWWWFMWKSFLYRSAKRMCVCMCVFHSYMDSNKKSLNVMVFELYMCCCKLQYDSNVFYTYNLENVYENKNIMYTAVICMWSACLGWSKIYQNTKEFKIFVKILYLYSCIILINLSHKIMETLIIRT